MWKSPKLLISIILSLVTICYIDLFFSRLLVRFIFLSHATIFAQANDCSRRYEKMKDGVLPVRTLLVQNVIFHIQIILQKKTGSAR